MSTLPTQHVHYVYCVILPTQLYCLKDQGNTDIVQSEKIMHGFIAVVIDACNVQTNIYIYFFHFFIIMDLNIQIIITYLIIIGKAFD